MDAEGRALLASGQEQTIGTRSAISFLAAANTIVRKRMRAGGFREDCGTRLPLQDAAIPKNLALWGVA